MHICLCTYSSLRHSLSKKKKKKTEACLFPIQKKRYKHRFFTPSLCYMKKHPFTGAPLPAPPEPEVLPAFLPFLFMTLPSDYFIFNLWSFCILQYLSSSFFLLSLFSPFAHLTSPLISPHSTHISREVLLVFRMHSHPSCQSVKENSNQKCRCREDRRIFLWPPTISRSEDCARSAIFKSSGSDKILLQFSLVRTICLILFLSWINVLHLQCHLTSHLFFPVIYNMLSGPDILADISPPVNCRSQ